MRDGIVCNREDEIRHALCVTAVGLCASTLGAFPGVRDVSDLFTRAAYTKLSRRSSRRRGVGHWKREVMSCVKCKKADGERRCMSEGSEAE